MGNGLTRKGIITVFIILLFMGTVITQDVFATTGATKNNTKNKNAIGDVPNIDAHPAYASITLRWPKVQGAEYYQLLRYDSASNKSIEYKVTNRDTDPGNKNWISCRDGAANNKGAYYSYYVYAVKTVKGKKVRSAVPAKAKYIRLVRQMYQTIYLKSSVTLSSHGGGYRLSRTFSAGTPIVATEFGGGQYKFYDSRGGKGRWFHVNYIRVSRAYADYSKTWNYSNITSENFVNELTARKIISKSSKSNYLIWISTYTQHLYIYKWDNKTKKWTQFRMRRGNAESWSNWEVSTGQAMAPTPIGFNKYIAQRIPNRHSIPYWSCFSSLNAFHGCPRGGVIDGAPHSSGCVRNLDSDAKWIYTNIPMGTPVVSY